MRSPSAVAPVKPSPAARGSARRSPTSLVLPVVAVAASIAAIAMLVGQGDATTLDYDVGIVPLLVPWLAALLAIAVAVMSLSGRWASAVAASAMLGVLAVLTVWSVVMLPFDALRVVGLVPLPLSEGGATTRLCLLVGAACALVAGQRALRTAQARCPQCGRVLPGRLDRLPRWPAGVAVVAALVYPTLRILWALGGTFGTAGHSLEMDAAVAWSPVFAGAGLVAFAAVLFVGRGPNWLRAILGAGGLVVGLAFAVAGGLGALKAAGGVLSDGFGSVVEGSGLIAPTFALVYGSWCVAGLGIMVGSWRFWAHRRDACDGCRDLLQSADDDKEASHPAEVSP
jgi:hypothetical protein